MTWLLLFILWVLLIALVELNYQKRMHELFESAYLNSKERAVNLYERISEIHGRYH